uniref:Uncharacterized protein n=1 Tax=Tanacetum cinerariifolium TaxID=118510 RepID=A0A6L2P054_TANCI|nr:hypothetical protein [Tanacetum cinerariifolium]
MVSSQCLQGWIQFPPLVSPDVDARNELPANSKHEGSSRKRRRLIQKNNMGSQRYHISNAHNVRGRVGVDCAGDVMDIFSLTQQVSTAAITQSTSDAFKRTIAKLIESSSSSGQGRMQILLNQDSSVAGVQSNSNAPQNLFRNTDSGTRRRKRPTYKTKQDRDYAYRVVTQCEDTYRKPSCRQKSLMSTEM